MCASLLSCSFLRSTGSALPALGDDAGADYNRIRRMSAHTLDDEMIDAAHVFVEYERRHPGSHYAVCSEVTLIDTATGSKSEICHSHRGVVAVREHLLQNLATLLILTLSTVLPAATG